MPSGQRNAWAATPPWLRLRSHLAPMVLIAMASWQFYHVQENGWSPWRGGGFGMYAGFHPSHAEAWVRVAGESSPIRVMRGAAEPQPYSQSLQDCLVRANLGCLLAAVHRMPRDSHVVGIELWRLSFDPTSALLRRELVAEYSREVAR